MTTYTPKTTDEAVKKATGKTWKQWVQTLNKLGAKTMPHKEIVILLKEKNLIQSSWWRQEVTVQYEKMTGRRVLGETKDAGFQIGVQKSMDISAAKAWKLLTSSDGLKIWLGTIPKLTLKKGSTYATKEGTTGEIRSIEKNKRLRLTYQPKNFKKPSTLQIYLLETNKKCSVRFHQEKLPSKTMRATMKTHWQGVLKKLQTFYQSS